MSKIGRPREYRDKEHKKRADYMREWYRRRREHVLELLRQDRLANPEKYRERDRQRYEKDKARRSALVRKWKRKNPDKRRQISAEWSARNREKKRANGIVKKAIERGELERQSCEICKSAFTEAHHDDYSKPLSVRWLCVKHHNEWHKQKRAEERKKK